MCIRSLSNNFNNNRIPEVFRHPSYESLMKNTVDDLETSQFDTNAEDMTDSIGNNLIANDFLPKQEINTDIREWFKTFYTFCQINTNLIQESKNNDSEVIVQCNSILSTDSIDTLESNTVEVFVIDPINSNEVSIMSPQLHYKNARVKNNKLVRDKFLTKSKLRRITTHNNEEKTKYHTLENVYTIPNVNDDIPSLTSSISYHFEKSNSIKDLEDNQIFHSKLYNNNKFNFNSTNHECLIHKACCCNKHVNQYCDYRSIAAAEVHNKNWLENIRVKNKKSNEIATRDLQSNDKNNLKQMTPIKYDWQEDDSYSFDSCRFRRKFCKIRQDQMEINYNNRTNIMEGKRPITNICQNYHKNYQNLSNNRCSKNRFSPSPIRVNENFVYNGISNHRCEDRFNCQSKNTNQTYSKYQYKNCFNKLVATQNCCNVDESCDTHCESSDQHCESSDQHCESCCDSNCQECYSQDPCCDQATQCCERYDNKNSCPCIKYHCNMNQPTICNCCDSSSSCQEDKHNKNCEDYSKTACCKSSVSSDDCNYNPCQCSHFRKPPPYCLSTTYRMNYYPKFIPKFRRYRECDNLFLPLC